MLLLLLPSMVVAVRCGCCYITTRTMTSSPSSQILTKKVSEMIIFVAQEYVFRAMKTATNFEARLEPWKLKVMLAELSFEFV